MATVATLVSNGLHCSTSQNNNRLVQALPDLVQVLPDRPNICRIVREWLKIFYEHLRNI